MPTMRVEMLLGNGPDFTRRIYDVLYSLQPRMLQLNLYPEKLGDFSTLPERLQTEVAAWVHDIEVRMGKNGVVQDLPYG